ncbi:MAG: NhaB family Na+:H+ antiporter [Pseudomonadales bacterium]|jgi:NhaB family Na+:H+ antiporter
MQQTFSRGMANNFLGNAPSWYKLTIIGFLILNPVLLAVTGPFVNGWALIGQFIFTLALALKCYHYNQVAYLLSRPFL